MHRILLSFICITFLITGRLFSQYHAPYSVDLYGYSGPGGWQYSVTGRDWPDGVAIWNYAGAQNGYMNVDSGGSSQTDLAVLLHGPPTGFDWYARSTFDHNVGAGGLSALSTGYGVNIQVPWGNFSTPLQRWCAPYARVWNARWQRWDWTNIGTGNGIPWQAFPLPNDIYNCTGTVNFKYPNSGNSWIYGYPWGLDHHGSRGFYYNKYTSTLYFFDEPGNVYYQAGIGPHAVITVQGTFKAAATWLRVWPGAPHSWMVSPPPPQGTLTMNKGTVRSGQMVGFSWHVY